MSPEIQQNEFGGTAESRIEKLIFYATRHGMLLSNMGLSIEDIRSRLRVLEEDRQRNAIQDARREEQDKALLNELKALKDQVLAMKGVVNKAVGVIFGAVLLAVIKWMLDGNLVG
jgi:DNA-binding transcriptional MerR regulator